MDAHGVELGLNGNVFSARNLSMDIFANAAYLHQIVTDMGGAPSIKVGYYRYRTWIVQGYAPGAFFTEMLADTPYPFDQNGDGQPDTQAEMLAYLSQPRTPDDLTLVRSGQGAGPDGEFYRGKPTPDWSGSFGADFTIFGNFRLNSNFEYAFGNYYHQDLSDAFRNSHWSLGRNTLATAQVEATLENPASTAEERLAAAQEWTKLVSLSPWSGMNSIEKADYIRWRELSLAYTVPGDFADRIGANRATDHGGRQKPHAVDEVPGDRPREQRGHHPLERPHAELRGGHRRVASGPAPALHVRRPHRLLITGRT